MRKPSVCGPPWSTCDGEDGHQHDEGHAHQADQREEHEDGADGKEAGDVLPAFFELLEHGVAAGARAPEPRDRIMSSETMTAK